MHQGAGEGTIIKRELRSAAGKAEDATNSRALEILARAGFAVSGVLHFLVGTIAIGLARERAAGRMSAAPSGSWPASRPGPCFCGAASRRAWPWPCGRPVTPSSTSSICPPKDKDGQEGQGRSAGRRLCRTRCYARSVRARDRPGQPGIHQRHDRQPPEGAGRRPAPGADRSGRGHHRDLLRCPRVQEVLRKAHQYAVLPQRTEGRDRPGHRRVCGQGRCPLRDGPAGGHRRRHGASGAVDGTRRRPQGTA